MKKVAIIVLALAFFAGMTGLVSAAQNVGNTSQKGSLLIFPKIDVSGYRDTIVMISNDYTSEVDVQCYWMDNYQNWEDFGFLMSKKQPVWFSAKTGIGNVSVPPFASFAEDGVGELKCWAVDKDYLNQISFNHLFGTAKVINFEGARDRGLELDSKSWSDGWAYEYSSWNFTARSIQYALMGTPGHLILSGEDTGTAYDGCPKYLLFNVAAVGAEWGYENEWGDSEGKYRFENKTTDLTFALCQQDLRQDRTPNVTKLKFTAWNGDEVKYTGAYACAKCWYESCLDYLEGGAFQNKANGSEKFLVESLHTDFALLRVQAVASTVCDFPTYPKSVAMGLVGLSVEFNEAKYYANRYDFGVEGAFYGRTAAVSGTTANGAGISVPGFILWDTEEGPVPELR
jgi:hypothetical protein